MIEKLLQMIVPPMLIKVRAIPIQQKQLMASLFADLALYYKNGDREVFEQKLAKFELDEDLQAAVMDALWNEHQS